MSERTETFSVGSRPRLELKLATGAVSVLPGQEGAVDVTVRSSKPELVIIEQLPQTNTYLPADTAINAILLDSML